MNAESVKARLKNFAADTGHTFQEALTYYGIERTVYRISISNYAEHFVLKGGILLYAIFDRQYERATTDIDFLARRISNRAEEMESVFRDILSIDTDDALVFDLSTIKVDNITEFKEYHGLHISVIGYLDRTRIPIGIDIGFGDVIYPEAVKMDFPTILNMETPKVNAYSIETAVAEKFEAIISNGYLNSRYKDFYDIYVLSTKYSFDYDKLYEAVAETFKNRNVEPSMETAAFTDDFLNDKMHRTRWAAFLKKKNAMLNLPMNEAIGRIKTFASPLLGAYDEHISIWDSIGGRWM